ncbi:nicotinate-nucleotide--dimethylbenzimidazole phosphoribosyltransferase [Alteribacillus iranensis]|uniref:Nicotinate-nucleotide--dimethylbenzimidazole phosphoribosyltransferase n=1 Tax=Alteribacillus iranensis TaxID=930128 RepID=A0A1I2B1N6_9BACI|nr:nicotinate-nucleotide--dimethylbenzimidazole phosphoribosyltransferase [Alteribacillus iranensis]SFE50074.1 nicotinate-nucleotide-dimethylbenzimidazole phosphoribosyltransferase [Alteribacillus iranensis]
MTTQNCLNVHIPSPDTNIKKQVATYIDHLTKPPGSLGRLETIATDLAAMTASPFPDVSPPGILVFAADHGIVDEGVSAFPQEITAKMAQNFLHRGAAINVFADQIDAHFRLVDIGMATEMNAEGMISRKVKHGTESFLHLDAMTKKEAMKALDAGYEEGKKMITDQGVKCLILGEMGIGNTTSSSAVIAALSKKPISEVTGMGTGLTKDRVQHKQHVITQALKNRKINRDDPLDVLAKVGGLEIAAMAGAMVAAASQRTPIILDGFISSTAALVAKALHPNSAEYMFVGHRSTEPGHDVALQLLTQKPLLELDMRLGEGTGAALSFPILKAACAMVKDMATFRDLENY